LVTDGLRMNPLDALYSVSPPPPDARTVAWGDPCWPELFKRLGTRLPEDFVQFQTTYGYGCFASRTHPRSMSVAVIGSITNFEFQSRSAELLTDMRLMKEKRPKSIPFPIYCEPGGLLPWGRISNGTILCWAVRGGLVDDWAVVAVRPTTKQAERYEMGFARFLAGLLSGQLAPAWAPKGLPGPKGVEFHVLQYGPP
jgi:hypothetical protein